MGKQFTAIDTAHQAFIEAQHLFFVATAASDGRVNVSPKGMNTFRVLGPNRIMWLNLTGSGNETAAHLRELNRMTIMFCAFAGKPSIMRLYGTAEVLHPRDAQWPELLACFPPLPGARQLFLMQVNSLSTSCGMAVPLLDYRAEREELSRSPEKKGPAKVEEYWAERNQCSIDGIPTGI